jgi:hypothetical protein
MGYTCVCQRRLKVEKDVQWELTCSGVQTKIDRADLLTADSTEPAWHLAKIPRQLQVNERAI